MLHNVTLSTTNYDTLLTAWALLSVQSSVPFDAGLSKYSFVNGYVSRKTLKTTYSWTITDGGYDTSLLNTPLTLECYLSPSSNLTVTLPLYGTVNAYVDWGTNPEHIEHYTTQGDQSYTYSTSGTYQVKIYNTLTQFGHGSTSYSNVSKLTQVLTFGEIGLTSLSGAFLGASSLTAVPTSLPLASNITDLSYTFKNATSFNQSIATWNVQPVSNMTQIFNGVTLSTSVYSDILIGWSVLMLTPNVTFDAGSSKYSYSAKNAKKSIITSYSWTFIDYGIDISTLTNPMILEYQTTGPSQSITLPLYGPSLNVTVVWNDTTDSDYTTTGDKSHSYTSAGTYQVYIIGTLKQFGNGSITYLNHERLLSVISFGEIGLTSLSGAFLDATSLTSVPTSLPTTTNITDLSYTFTGATNFNSNISNWNTQYVSTFEGLFYGATSFNQSINAWNTSSVINMNSTFKNASSFNQALNSWVTNNVATMHEMFANATSFDKSLSSWNTSSVTTMESMFSNTSFNQPINAWNTTNVTNMIGMFANNTVFNQTLSSWNIEQVTTMKNMFLNTTFNQDISNWNPISLTTAEGIFQGNTSFSTTNYSALLVSWSSKSLQSSVLFHAGSAKFSYPTAADGKWSIRTNYNWTFTDGGILESSAPAPMVLKVSIPIGSDLKMRLPLYGQTDTIINWGDSTFDEYITNGDKEHLYSSAGDYIIQITRTLTQFGKGSTSYLYADRITEITSFGGIRLTSLAGAFINATSLTVVPYSLPTTSIITSLVYTFKGATSLNSAALTNWDVSTVTNMTSTFDSASSFNQNLSNWNVSNVTTMQDMFLNVTLSRTNYDALLYGWAALILQPNVIFNGGNSIYTYPTAYLNRKYIKTTYNWTITDGGVDPTTLTNPMILEYNIALLVSPNNIITLPLYGSVNVTVIWDSSDIDDYTTTGDKTHTYNSLGTKTVYIIGSLTHFGHDSASYNYADRLISVISFGEIGLTSLAGAFINATSLVSVPTLLPTTSNITSLAYTFKGATLFNDVNIIYWNVYHVTNFQSMFYGATSFNQNIASWGVNTGNSTNFNAMFYGASSFNKNISTWSTSNATDMAYMFSGASSFNQNISNWNVNLVTDMTSMFESATSFDQNLSSWNVSNVSSMINMFLNVTLSVSNYDSMLIAWSGLSLQSGVYFNAGNQKYTYPTAADARLYIKNNFNWTIVDGGVLETSLPTSMSLVYTVIPGNLIIRLPLYGTVDVIIDWGDSQVSQTDNQGDFEHTYLSPGTYTVTIKKTLTQFGNESTPYLHADRLTNVISFGEIRLTSLAGAFYNATNLVSVPSSLPSTTNVASLAYTFKGATSFDDSSVANWDVSLVTDMTSMFENVTLSTSVYNSILTTWRSLPLLQQNVTFHGGNSIYTYGLPSQAKFYIIVNYLWNITDDGIDPASLPPSMELQFYLLPGNLTVTLPLYGMVDVTVEWGDSTMDNYTTAGDKTHTYATDGFKNIVIINYLTEFGKGSSSYQSVDRLIQVISFGEIGLTSLAGAFNGASNLIEVPDNLPITSSITSLAYTFKDATSFNDEGVITWDVSSVTDMTSTFENAQAFNQNIHDWDVSNVTLIENIFKNAILFNKPLNLWDISQIISFNSVFENASAFNQSIQSWNISNGSSFVNMFKGALAFNQSLGGWSFNTNPLVNIDVSSMFNGAISFNQPIQSWNTSRFAITSYMFANNYFNQLISDWDVSNVSDFSYMFYNNNSFNKNINRWILSSSSSIILTSMFNGATSFNQNIGNWNVSQVINMDNMFYSATSFNQDLNRWDVSSTTSMIEMFRNASSFNHKLNDWVISSILSPGMTNMFTNSGLSNYNYTLILIGWASLAPLLNNNIVLGAASKRYYTDASSARSVLTSSYNWTINDSSSLGISIPAVELNNPYRYFKWIIKATKSPSDRVSASELRFYDQLYRPIDLSLYSIINVNGSNPINQDVSKLVDNDEFTKWADLNGPNGYFGRTGGSVLIDFGVDFINTPKPYYYSWYTADDELNTTSDPKTWDLETSELQVKWFKVSEISSYSTPETRESEVSNSVNGENYFMIEYPPDPNIFRMIFSVNAGETITLPLFGAVNVTVNWGDSTETFTTPGFKKHTYLTSGNHSILITGSLEKFGNGFEGYPGVEKMIKVTSFGNIGLVDMSGAFKDAVNLIEGPDFIPSTVTNLEYAFYNAKLYNDPYISDWDMSNVTNISYMFFNATAFNQDIFNWNPVNLVNKQFFLYGATSFNQPISGWLKDLFEEDLALNP
jgi:surface protein